jgi:LmbE family N-acetylglucosaminyl deacetylase
MKRVSCVIPAYNESATIASVVRAARTCPQVDEVIVVSDGSTDQTPRIAVDAGADHVLVLRKNCGKGSAIMAGVQAARGDVILLLDGDLCGLAPEHIARLVRPVLTDRAAMAVASFADDVWHGVLRPLSGQRAVRRDLLLQGQGLSRTGFGFEIALARLAKTRGVRTVRVSWAGVSHRLKSAKYGMMQGLRLQLRASSDLVRQTRPARRHRPARSTGSGRRTRMEALVIAVLLLAVLARPMFFAHPSQAAVLVLPTVSAPSAHDRVLVVVAHPDDDVIGAGGFIAAARRIGVPVSVLFITNGDSNRVTAALMARRLPVRHSAFIREGRLRQQEALEALQQLGVAPADIFFLGFPDRELVHVMESPWDPVISRYTGLGAADYSGVVGPGAPYNRASLVGLTRTIVARVQPTLVITHSPLDRHSDHVAVAQLVDLVHGSAVVYAFVVYAPGFPRPLRSAPKDPLLPPPSLDPPPQWAWMRFELSPDVARAKRAAIAAHRSQLATPYLRLLLSSFNRTNELFVVRPDDMVAAHPQ